LVILLKVGYCAKIRRGKAEVATHYSSRRKPNNTKKRRRKTPAFLKSKNENQLGMVTAFLAIITLTIVVGVNSITLNQKDKTYEAREQELLAQIADEDARTLELEELATYTKTKKYAEEVAKDKLGLVYENEIIFQESN
jgi:cell division protein DivIC